MGLLGIKTVTPTPVLWVGKKEVVDEGRTVLRAVLMIWR